MEDGLAAADRVVHAFVAPQLALDHLDVEAREVLPASGREVVEDAHGVAAGEQAAHDVRADEAAPPGDEHRHRSAATWKLVVSEPGTGSRRRRELPSIAAAAELITPAASWPAQTACILAARRSM